MSAEDHSQIVDLDDVLMDAADGSQQALRILANYVIGQGAHGDMTMLEALAGAECCARLASAHGDADSKVHLALVLQLQAQHRAAAGLIETALEAALEADHIICTTPISGDDYAAQAYGAVLTHLADRGDADAAIRLNHFVGRMSKEEAAKVRSTEPSIRWMMKTLLGTVGPAAIPHADQPPAPIEPVPLTRRERLRFWVSNIQWTLQCLGWAFGDLWRAIRGKY